jgi:hypothetical protein
MSHSMFDLSSRSSAKPVTAKMGNSTFWAERGLIHCETDGDLREGEPRYMVIRLRDMLERLRMVNMTRAALRSMPVKDLSVIREHEKFVDDMIEVCRMAKAQGSPFNPDVIEHAINKQKRSRVAVIDPSTKTVTPGGGFNPEAIMNRIPRKKI